MSRRGRATEHQAGAGPGLRTTDAAPGKMVAQPLRAQGLCGEWRSPPGRPRPLFREGPQRKRMGTPLVSGDGESRAREFLL